MSTKMKAGALLQERPPAKRRAKKLPPHARHEAPKGRKPRNLEVDEKYAKVFDKIILANGGDLKAERFVDGYLHDVAPANLNEGEPEDISLRTLELSLIETGPDILPPADRVAKHFELWGQRIHRCIKGRVVPVAIITLISDYPSPGYRDWLNGAEVSGETNSPAPVTRDEMRRRRLLLMLQILRLVEDLELQGVDPYVNQ